MNLLEKIYSKFFDKAYLFQKNSYSQCGEDLIIDFLFSWVLKIKDPVYIDIGAHHPHDLNNTYLFYKRGLTGINIEPDPVLFSQFVNKRPKDINLNCGVGFNSGREMADFYVMSSRTLNTFSKEEAHRMSESGSIQIKEVKQIELININDVISNYYPNRTVDILSIDVEGLDLEILKSLDFTKYKPNVICVETIIFSENSIIKKQQSTIDFLLSNGYFSYADTSINTIFVRKDLF